MRTSVNTLLGTHVSHGLADESQLSGLVDRAPQLAGVAAVGRHRLGSCDDRDQTPDFIEEAVVRSDHLSNFCITVI